MCTNCQFSWHTMCNCVCWLADKRWGFKRCGCTVTVPAVREQQEANTHVHQQPRFCSIAHITTHTTVQWPFVRDYPGRLVPEETFTHSQPFCSLTDILRTQLLYNLLLIITDTSLLVISSGTNCLNLFQPVWITVYRPVWAANVIPYDVISGVIAGLQKSTLTFLLCQMV